MKYRESNLDRDLRKRFTQDNTRQLLRGISLTEGKLRGLTPFDVDFTFPITAFAGVNGAGKSTLLAMVCCGYHNKKTGFKLPKRKTSYYTFSDFFVQHRDEVPPQGIEIRYRLAHDNWATSENAPNKSGIRYQARKKREDGRWNDYAARIKKNVVFLGIERIVPHAERSQSRSYSKYFKAAVSKGWEDKVKDIVGGILGKKYDNFRYLEHSRYSLPIVQVGKSTYSGFNMGAGENALFEIFSTIYSSGGNTLLVLDEIELGLHAKAQKIFMEKLKNICKETSTQVICTTHSKEIFNCLPDDARFFIENIGGSTKITPEISPDFAFSKMSSSNKCELDIFVEDNVAKIILQNILPAELRSRIKIIVIGSATAIARQLAALHIRGEEKATIAIFDGDQRIKEADNLRHAKSMHENCTNEFEKWYKARIAYLPGDTWPEAWLINKCKTAHQQVASELSIDEGLIEDLFIQGLQAGKHNEFHAIANDVGLDKDQCLNHLAKVANNVFPGEFSGLYKLIASKL